MADSKRKELRVGWGLAEYLDLVTASTGKSFAEWVRDAALREARELYQGAVELGLISLDQGSAAFESLPSGFDHKISAYTSIIKKALEREPLLNDRVSSLRVSRHTERWSKLARPNTEDPSTVLDALCARMARIEEHIFNTGDNKNDESPENES